VIRSAERVDLVVVEARGGLVEQQQLGVGRQRPGEFDALLGAEGQVRDHRVGHTGQAQELDQFCGTAAGGRVLGGHAAQPAARS
jgi:hypothetical protein